MKRFISVSAILLIICTVIGKAQWYNPPGTQSSESQVPINGLSYIPTLRTDMSLDCFIGYIAMDSAARTEEIPTVLAHPMNTTIPKLQYMSRFLYAMREYDPTLLRRHMFSTRDSAFPNNRYRSFPANAFYGIEDAIIERRNEFGNAYAMLIIADYILKVRIDEVAEGIDSVGGNPYSYKPYLNAVCTILDTIKGKHIPYNCYYPTATVQANSSTLTNSSSNCFKFGYHKTLSVGGGFSDRPTPKGRIRVIQPGEEYYVFLVHVALNDSTDFIMPESAFEKSGGLFKIVNGNVEDLGGFWGGGTLPTETQFITNIQNKINTIKSWTAPTE